MKVKIGDLTKIKTGKLDANASSEDGQYPFFTCSREPLKISTYSYDCECVLVAGNGDLNVKYYNGKFDAYQRTYIIEDNDSGKLFMPYLYYFMEGYIEELRKQAIGGVIKYIKLGNLTDALIELPSVDEQKAIVDILEKSKKVLDMRHEEISKLDDLIKARFVEMLGNPATNEKGWNEYTLSEKLNVVGGYAFKSNQFDENDGIPVLRIGNINSGYFKSVNMVFWREDESLERYVMYPGDLVMSLTGTVGKEDYGNVCILGDDYEKYYLNQRNAKLEIKEGIDKYYLSQLLKFEQIKKRLTGINRGVRQANISNKDILNLVVPIPPIELQNQFATFVKQVNKSKVAVQKALDETQLLFNSLMQEYFG